jgi:hypothetical protein
MVTIRDYYAAAIVDKKTLLKEMIELIVFEKGLMTLEQPMEDFKQRFLCPPDGKADAWNQRYREALTEMREKKLKGDQS